MSCLLVVSGVLLEQAELPTMTGVASQGEDGADESGEAVGVEDELTVLVLSICVALLREGHVVDERGEE